METHKESDDEFLPLQGPVSSPSGKGEIPGCGSPSPSSPGIPTDQGHGICSWASLLSGGTSAGSQPEHPLEELTRQWAGKANPKLTIFAGGTFLILVEDDQQLHCITQKQAWRVGGRTLVTCHWQPSIAKGLQGELLEIDTQTRDINRGGFARIRVELPLSAPLPPEFQFVLKDSHTLAQPLVYEGKLRFCRLCGVDSHPPDKCPKCDSHGQGNFQHEAVKGKNSLKASTSSIGPIAQGEITHSCGRGSRWSDHRKFAQDTSNRSFANPEPAGPAGKRKRISLGKVEALADTSPPSQTSDFHTGVGEGIVSIQHVNIDSFFIFDTLINVYRLHINSGLLGSYATMYNADMCDGVFRYFHFWASRPQCKYLVQEAWSSRVFGCPLVRMIKKLEFTRSNLSSWARNCVGDISLCIKALRVELDKVQSIELASTDNDKNHEILIRKELQASLEDEDSLWRQRARVKWMAKGDRNTTYYQAIVKGCKTKNSLCALEHEGTRINNVNHIRSICKDFFDDLLGSEEGSGCCLTKKDDGPRLQDEDNATLLLPTTLDEVINSFLSTGRLVKKVNRNYIALIPKKEGLYRVDDLRPIALCNVLYKIISKFLSCRMKRCLQKVISKDQGAFFPERSITENIIFAHECIHSLEGLR
ncbi:uncharacterized protein LOC116255992 [Nymphaea colorata]|uniref:uncharacterized protein LOC116255992 n=1 Tax=Nymphaea colorata TaxID=210225 RepID=UPI00129D2ABB|nr:uncharacterized protein LOC116255992 [Nymphaea colorata]